MHTNLASCLCSGSSAPHPLAIDPFVKVTELTMLLFALCSVFRPLRSLQQIRVCSPTGCRTVSAAAIVEEASKASSNGKAAGKEVISSVRQVTAAVFFA